MSLIILLLLVSVLMNVVAQVSLKRAVLALSGVRARDLLCLSSLSRILMNPYVILFVAMLVPSLVLWVKILSMTDLSFAYPFQSLTMVLIPLGSVVFLKERVTTRQWSGIGLILLGIALISGS